MDVFIDQKNFEGEIFEQLSNTMKFILSHIHLHGEIGDDFVTRIDEYEILPDAIREAVVNALVHRDYGISGSDIKVAIYDRKIEIISPGSFPKSMMVEEVVGGRSEIRNKVLIRIFKEANKTDR